MISSTSRHGGIHPPTPPRRLGWLRRQLAPALGLTILLGVAAVLAEPPTGPAIAPGEMVLLESPPATAGSDDALPWEPIDSRRLAKWRGPFLLRYRVTFTASDTAEPYAIAVSLRAAFIATWDGLALPPNGIVGSDAVTEVPGRVDWIAPIPTGAAATGEHELLLRASNARATARFRTASVGVRVAPLSALVLHWQRAWLMPALALGALLTAGLSSLAALARSSALAGGRDLVALAASAAGLTIAEAWRPLIGYTYPWHAVRLRLILLLTALTMVFLVRYVLRRHGSSSVQALQRTTWLMLAGFLVIGLVVPTYDFAAWLMHVIGIGVCLVATLRTRHSDAERELGFLSPLLAVSLATMLMAPQAWLYGLSVIAVATMLVVVLLAHTAQLREQAAHTLALEHTRQRLTTALIRRSIQPHWLMNTLTALQELIEQDPARASQLVEALAEEFRLVTSASQRAWITGAQELALCRAHLAIVSHALLAKREMQVSGEAILADIGLPPGILHTLLENGLTHANVQAAHAADFALDCRVAGDVLSLNFEAPLGRIHADGVPMRRGTGTLYIETSLESAFPGAWSFTQGAHDGRWKATIELSCTQARAARSHAEV